MGLTLIVTNAGRAALVNAANTGTNPVTIAQVGLTATAVTPDPTATALPGEFKRLATLSGDVVADDTIHLIVRDKTGDVFTVRSLALYLADGTLFAIYGQAGVLVEKSAQALMLLAIDVQFADIDAADLTFGDANFLNPPATTSQQGVVELATTAEAQAGIDALRALTPAAAKAAILGWLLAQDGAGSGLDADLLDGQQGSYYTNITGRLGYTPANKAGDTFTGDITAPRINLTANGDGQAAKIGDDCWIGDINITNTMGIRGVQDASQGYVVFGNGDSAKLGRVGTGALTYAGNVVWHAGVDGAGSGLDADLLDGQQGSYYAPINGPTFAGLVTLSAADSAKASINIPHGAAPSAPNAGDVWSDTFGFYGRVSSVTRQFAMTSGVQTLSSKTLVDPALTGTPTAPNANPGANSTQIATTAFVQSGIVPGNIISKLITVDGSGSGLDADLLDGQHGSYYTDIAGRLGYTPASGASNNLGNVDLNTVVNSGMYRFDVPTNGPGPTYAQLLVIHGASDTITQIVGNWGNGDLWTRSGNPPQVGGSGSWGAWSKLWATANDGAGSGLDADLLDGQQGSYYAPINSPNFTGSAIWVNSGSLILQHDGSHAYIRPTNGGGSLNLGAGDVNHMAISPAGLVTIGGATVWHAGNDGAGSGLDADLLDGFQGSAYDRITSISLVENGGYIIFASGYKRCWGTATVAANGATVINYPITFNAFSNASFSAARTVDNAQDNDPEVYSHGTNSCTVWSAADSSLSGRWRAEGY